MPLHYHCSEGFIASSGPAQGDLRYTVGQQWSPFTAVALFPPVAVIWHFELWRPFEVFLKQFDYWNSKDVPHS